MKLSKSSWHYWLLRKTGYYDSHFVQVNLCWYFWQVMATLFTGSCGMDGFQLEARRQGRGTSRSDGSFKYGTKAESCASRRTTAL